MDLSITWGHVWRKLSVSQKESPHWELNQMAHWSCTSYPPELWERNFCCLNHLVCGVLLWQPELTSAGCSTAVSMPRMNHPRGSLNVFYHLVSEITKPCFCHILSQRSPAHTHEEESKILFLQRICKHILKSPQDLYARFSFFLLWREANNKVRWKD